MATILIDFGDSELAGELMDNLKYYARLEGITQKRMFLLGMAKYLENTGE